jgi:DNA-binding CsgD family transcriptional regulator
MKEILEQYTLHFGEQAKKLITLVDKDRFQLTDAMLPNFKGLEPKEQISINLEFYLAKIQYELVKLGTFISPSLSPQELKCITLLIQGKTATDIANMLCLSNRTVEMHLNSIKNKLNCRKKSDIIGALINLAAAKADK